MNAQMHLLLILVAAGRSRCKGCYVGCMYALRACKVQTEPKAAWAVGECFPGLRSAVWRSCEVKLSRGLTCKAGWKLLGFEHFSLAAIINRQCFNPGCLLSTAAPCSTRQQRCWAPSSAPHPAFPSLMLCECEPLPATLIPSLPV